MHEQNSGRRFVRTNETTRFQPAVLAVWLISFLVSIAVVTCFDTRVIDTVWHVPSDLTIFVIMAMAMSLVVSVPLCFLAKRLLVMRHNMVVLILTIVALAVVGGIVTSGSLLLGESVLIQALTPEFDIGN
jgi:hypothetical protein